MQKKVLALYFTQTGQLKDIVDQFTLSLEEDPGIELEKRSFSLINSFSFPWTSPSFFNAMPESVGEVPAPLKPIETTYQHYDLIILGYQPWFLSPSIPVTSLLQSDFFKTIAKDTPVVAITGCRNMWINAIEKIKKRLIAANAPLKGHVALVDEANNYVSLVTIFYWMLTGKKDRKWGIFPPPGVAKENIDKTYQYGETVKQHLHNGNWDDLQDNLHKQKALNVKYGLMFIERKAGKIFKIWHKIIAKNPGRRATLLVFFKYYLLIALCVAAPLILLVDAVLFRPFLQKRIKRQMAYYAGVSYREKP